MGFVWPAASLAPDPGNPTLENNTADVHYETDFRAVREGDRQLAGREFPGASGRGLQNPR
jgi:hypothetical protein